MFTDCFEEYLPYYDFKVLKDVEFDEEDGIELEILSDSEWKEDTNENNERPNRKIIKKAKFLDNGEILLPGGKIIGHR